MCHESLVGVKWIKQKYGEELRIIRIGQKGYLETIEQGLIQGIFVQHKLFSHRSLNKFFLTV